MYNTNDIQLARERYEELVHSVEVATSYKRDESGAVPVGVSFGEKLMSWKASLRRVLHLSSNQKEGLQQIR